MQRAFPLRSGAAWVLLAAYAAGAVALAGHALIGGSTRIVGSFSDPIGFVWWLAEAAHWVFHGGSLFHPDLANAPRGMSALWNTSVLGLGVPAAPITEIFGPVVAYNVLITLGIALDAWVMALAAGRWVSRPAAIAAGAVFGFGAYTASQSEAHLHLVVMVYPPLVLLLATDLFRGASRERTAVVFAVATAWQFFVSTEVLATCALFGAVMLAAALFAAPGLRRRLLGTCWAMVPGIVLSGVVLAVPLALLWKTPMGHHLFPRPIAIYSANLANLLVPTPVQMLDPGARVFAGDLAEGGLYLGIPLLGILVFGCIATW